MAKVAFIGLGVMGYPMAGHLARAGHNLVVYNRSRSKTDAWLAEHPGQGASSPAEAALNCDIVMACVGNDEDLRAVTIESNGAFESMQQGAVFIDHTTASPALARTLYTQAQARGFHFLDAPVSGGQAGAINGQLTIMVGGDAAPFAQCEPILATFARAVTHIGPAGSGQLCKCVNQICIAGLLQGLSEGIHFGQRAGLNMTKVLEVISKGAAQSWQMENRGQTMLQNKFDFGFAVDWMRKDLQICQHEAAQNGADLQVTKLIDMFYAEIQAMGGQRWDTSSLIKRLSK